MNQFPLWLRLSLLHPAVGILLLGLGKILPHAGAAYLGAAYYASLVGFIINVPGVILIRRLLVFAHHPKVPHYMLLFMMILLTWAVVVAPICWLINRTIASHRSHE